MQKKIVAMALGCTKLCENVIPGGLKLILFSFTPGRKIYFDDLRRTSTVYLCFCRLDYVVGLRRYFVNNPTSTGFESIIESM